MVPIWFIFWLQSENPDSVMTARDILSSVLMYRYARIGFKVGQIGPKLDESGTFSDKKSLMKKSRICHIWVSLTHFWAQIWPPWFGKLQIKQQDGLDDASF